MVWVGPLSDEAVGTLLGVPWQEHLLLAKDHCNL